MTKGNPGTETTPLLRPPFYWDHFFSSQMGKSPLYWDHPVPFTKWKMVLLEAQVLKSPHILKQMGNFSFFPNKCSENLVYARALLSKMSKLWRSECLMIVRTEDLSRNAKCIMPRGWNRYNFSNRFLTGFAHRKPRFKTDLPLTELNWLTVWKTREITSELKCLWCSD